MLGMRFWNVYLFREYDYSCVNESSQFHLDGNGWYTCDFNYYEVGNGYFAKFREDYDINCIYEIKEI